MGGPKGSFVGTKGELKLYLWELSNTELVVLEVEPSSLVLGMLRTELEDAKVVELEVLLELVLLEAELDVLETELLT
eukprot:CAMPEP_0114582786 /NCGR_PEP_ID=MMETSP0125-20121206/6677_1 /TAXON_ID=485358 ORGANISM="Aristerostoma sp., Strain ATCC 50986" /NCGR_SAMPLE_ID=MMETSP0125 /ASSEMBLY_ACC=CAM_ASM_000245 /LENGTH=76 /DNA_ID=CAMNT_0001775907 /DNA_START=707 /DNA_END=937 /DNA_ORIENTATION=+